MATSWWPNGALRRPAPRAERFQFPFHVAVAPVASLPAAAAAPNNEPPAGGAPNAFLVASLVNCDYLDSGAEQLSNFEQFHHRYRSRTVVTTSPSWAAPLLRVQRVGVSKS